MPVRSPNRDLPRIERDPPFNVMIDPFDNDNEYHWHGIMIGPLNTPYENGIFHFKVDFPDDYPILPLKIQLLTKIFHPNVFPNGFICMDILQDTWAQSYSISSVLLSFVSLLFDPNPTDPSNPEAAHYYRSDREKYNQIARQWTQRYAIDSAIEQKIDTAKLAITQELNDIETNHSSDVNVRPFDMRDLFYWQGTIMGPENSPYQDRSYTINIRFPLNYPEKAPSIVFRSYIYHPNIDGCIGDEDFKTKWTSNLSISKMLQDLSTLLSNPKFDDSNNSTAAQLYRNDREKYNQIARERNKR